MLILSISLWRKSDVETIRGPCGLKSRRKKNKTVGGFVLAGSAQEKTKTAQVVATGQGVRTLNGDLVAPSVKAGDRVLVEAHAGLDVKDGDEKYIIVGEANILAIIEE